MRRIACRTALVAMVIGAVAAACAEAATVSVQPNRTSLALFLETETIAYAAGPGEANRVIAESAAVGSAWTVSDSGAIIAAGPGCTAVDAHTARCAGDVGLADLRLGDREDIAVLVQGDAAGPFPLYAEGGPGDDVLSLTALGGELRGGPGDDRLTSATTFARSAVLDGGGGRDELSGGGGDELLSDGDVDSAAGPDLIDGGLGADTVDYGVRSRPVAVDLAAGRGGIAGEGDTLIGVEHAIGGAADDRLAGDVWNNTLDGRGGANTLIGRRGDDTFLHARGPVFCGDGDDTISGSSARDLLAPGCEAIDDLYGFDDYPAYPVAAGRRWVRHRVHCFVNEEEGSRYPCHGRITLREPRGQRRRLGRGAFPVGRWADHPVTVTLSPLGRRLAARRSGVPATVRLTIFDAGFSRSVQRWTIRLRVAGAAPRTGRAAHGARGI